MAVNKNLASLRREYLEPEFGVKTVEADPYIQFDKWFEEMMTLGSEEVNCMTLATASTTGRPGARIVLLKGIEDGQFVFYTNYQSAKGREIEQNPHVCLNFYWPELSRQVRIDGIAERVSEAAATTYFQSRPRGAQVGAWASPQSAPIANRQVLEERAHEMEEKFKGQEVLPKPKQWGGYGVKPVAFEFWQGRPDRLHDRICYLLDGDNQWNIQRLSP